MKKKRRQELVLEKTGNAQTDQLTFLKTRIDPQKWLEMMFGHREMDGIGNL